MACCDQFSIAKNCRLGDNMEPSADATISCSSTSSISECRSARIIKVFLKKLQSANPSEIIQSIRTIFESHNYSVTDILNDVHHLKYEHGVDGDDEKFDEIFAFLSDGLTGRTCTVTDCVHIRRHHRDRGTPPKEFAVTESDDVDDTVLMDTMAMVHCYFVHSFDLNRLTKEERDRIDTELSIGTGLEDDEKIPIENELFESKRIKLINSILAAKKKKLVIGRGDERYRDDEDDRKSAINQNVDFCAISKTVNIDEAVLMKGLKDYEKNRDRFIGDLIDVIYAENAEEMKLWSTLEMEHDAKRVIFHEMLFGHFECIQLNTANLLKLSVFVIDRKRLQIDGDALKQEVMTNDIDGRMFDKTDREHFENMVKFSKRFKETPNCNAQHLRQLYTALRRWRYIEPKKQTVEEKRIEHEMFESKKIRLIDTLRTAKSDQMRTGRGGGRFQNNEDDAPSGLDSNLDFSAIAEIMEVDIAMLREGLKEYEKDRDRFIGELVDVVYAENPEMAIWRSLPIKDGAKRAIFHGILFGHFECAQLNTANLIKLSMFLIDRKRLEIDDNALKQELFRHSIDGRLFDKRDSEHFQKMGHFAKRFKSAPNCKRQHLGQLYRALRNWRYIEYKVQKEIPVEDVKEDEKEDQPPDVYEIGRRFYFWDSHRKHPDFIKPKYENIKEEVLNSPLLSGLITIAAWNALTALIERMIGSDAALQISSNGQSQYMYQLKKREPIDANHLRSLKLYTDYTDLSAKFCAILRWADPEQIAEIAHWTRSLIEMVQCFGSSLNDDAVQKTYFRGVDRTFIFKTIATKFHLPLSTTCNVKCDCLRSAMLKEGSVKVFKITVFGKPSHCGRLLLSPIFRN